MSSRIDLRIRPECARRWLTGPLRACNVVTRLTIEHGQLHAWIRSDGRQPVSVSRESRIGRRVTLLKILTLDARSRSYLLVLVDFGPQLRNVPADEFRRLRMWFRLGQTSRFSASTT